MKKLFTMLILLFLWTTGMTQQSAVMSTSNVAPNKITKAVATPVKGDFIIPNSGGKSPVAVRPMAPKKESRNVNNPSTGTPNPLAPLQGGDVIANATVIASLPYNITGTTAGYTDNYNEVCPFTATGGLDVVYSYTPAVNGMIDITLCGDITEFDTKLYVYDTPTPVTGDAIACNDDYCSNSFNDYISEITEVAVTAGVTYYIVVDGYSSVDNGTYEISVTNTVLYPVPVNDDCSTATVVSGTFPQTVNGTTLGATVDCPGILDWDAVWYAVTLPYTTNDLTVDWCGTEDMATVGIVYYPTCPVVCGDYIVATSYSFQVCGTPADANTAIMQFTGIPGPTTIYYPAYSIPKMDHVLTFDVVDGTVTCPAPTALTVSNLTTTSADLSWTAGGAETNWNVEVGLPGFTVGTDTYVFRNSGPENPLTATPLDPGTLYQFYVQADCGGDLSIWVGPFNFYTLCDLSCPTGGIPESEACGDDLNGGCNMPVPAFENVNAGDIICGTTWADAGTRDTDWFSLVLTTSSHVILHADAEAQIVFAQLDYGTGTPGAPVCPSAGFISSSIAGPCAPQSLDLGNLPAGTHWFFAGANGFDGLPCSIDYWMEFEVNPPSIECGNTDLGLLTPTTTPQNYAYAAGDSYYWSFNATAGEIYTFSNCGAGEDTYLRIYDASYVEVAYNDDFGIHCSSETAASLDFIPSSSGMYYVSLANYPCDPLEGAGNLEYYYTPAPAYKTLELTSVLLEGLYAGGGLLNQAYNEIGPQFPGYADEITVELHNAASYSIIEHSSSVMLNTDGTATVDDIPASLNGNYYITIRHRNSIETTTAVPVSFAGSTINQSFATPAGVYGGNLLLMLDGGYAIYGGDVNQDGAVDGGDVTPFDNDQFNYVSGYVPTDINGDAIIDSGDGTIIDNNQFNYVGAVLPPL